MRTGQILVEETLSRLIDAGRYFVTISVIVGVLAGASAALITALSLHAPLIRRALLTDVSHPRGANGRLQLTEGAWHEQLSKQEFWSKRGGQSTSRSAPEPVRDDEDAAPVGSRDDTSGFQGSPSGTYKTVCVRLCDGYYWPMSFATTSAGFERDRVRCESSCNSPAQLFVYRAADHSDESLVSLSGVPYTKLSTAFLYRARYDAACACKPQPWDRQALDRHRVYALESLRVKTAAGKAQTAAAVTEIKLLNDRVAAAEHDSRAAAQRRSEGIKAEMDALAQSATPLALPRERSVYVVKGHSTKAASREPRTAEASRRFDGDDAPMMRLGGRPRGSPSRSSSPSTPRASGRAGGEWRQRAFPSQ